MKILITIIFVLTLVSFNNQAVAETKDCSQYNTNTFFGTLDKRKCEKGLPVKERESLGTKVKNLWPFKKK
jgi:hypothetical protein|tara:strand:+ start:296 stop:505 length:210 start_codon:yes stop_codon:yes gene_type:complete